MAKGKRTPFKNLLEENRISFSAFYESCLSVATDDISALYEYNMAVRPRLERMVAHLNRMTGKQYQLDDVYVEKLYE
jgi:hypothetical protein